MDAESAASEEEQHPHANSTPTRLEGNTQQHKKEKQEDHHPSSYTGRKHQYFFECQKTRAMALNPLEPTTIRHAFE